MNLHRPSDAGTSTVRQVIHVRAVGLVARRHICNTNRADLAPFHDGEVVRSMRPVQYEREGF
jgi:hypothetical protein